MYKFLAPSVYTLLFLIICNVYTLYIDIYRNIYIDIYRNICRYIDVYIYIYRNVYTFFGTLCIYLIISYYM